MLQGLFPPGQGATIGVDFMIKTVEVDGLKIKVCVYNSSHQCIHYYGIQHIFFLIIFTFSSKFGIQLVKRDSGVSHNHTTDQLMLLFLSTMSVPNQVLIVFHTGFVKSKNTLAPKF